MGISQSTSQLRSGSNDIKKYVNSVIELFTSGDFKIGVKPDKVSSVDKKALEEFKSLGEKNKKKEACLVPFNANNNKMYTFGQILKPVISANMGDVAEGVLAAAIACRFINKNSTVTKSDVNSLIQGLPTPTDVGKAKSVEQPFKSENKDTDLKDDVILKITLSEYNMKFFLDVKSQSDLDSYIDSAVKYANDPKVQKWSKMVYENHRSDKIQVTANGLGNKTKVDVDVKITDDKNVLQDVDIKVSLKVDDVKQFGQQGGTLFKATGKKKGYKEYWDNLFGIDISSQENDYNKMKGVDHNTSGAINLIYDYVAVELQKKLNDKKSSGSILIKLGKAIQYYATLNEEHVELVQLTNGDAKIYNFTNLPNVIKQYEWNVKFSKGTSSSSGKSFPIITIHEKGDSANILLILRVKIETLNNAPYYRNYIEKGKFLGDLISRSTSS